MDFTVTAGQVTLNGAPTPLIPRAVEWGQDGPVLHALLPTDAVVTGDGVVVVVRDPTMAEIDQAARAVLASISPDLLEKECAARLATGRRDPYRVALEVIAGWTK